MAACSLRAALAVERVRLGAVHAARERRARRAAKELVMQARALAGARIARSLGVRVGRLDGGARLLWIGFLLFLGEPPAGIGQILGAARGGGQKGEEQKQSH